MDTHNIILDPDQRAVVESDSKLILCISGPGSGKTRVLVERVKRLVRDGADPSGMALITYTNAASDEMRERLGGIVPGHIGTLHSFCTRLMMDAWVRLALVTEDHEAAIIEQVSGELRYNGTDGEVRAAIKKGPTWRPANPFKSDLAAMAFWDYLRRNRLTTFDGILHFALPLAKESKRWTHLFVDEAQDMAYIDSSIYGCLPAGNKFWCGDSDQSIFAFRGGNVNEMLFLASLESVKMFILSKNYRSGQAICAAANNLIRNNRNRIDKETITSNFDTHSSVECFQCDDEKDQLQVILSHVDSDYEGGAVLCRTNRQADSIATSLKAQGIPVITKAQTQIPTDWQKALDFLAFAADPDNDAAAEWWLHYDISASQLRDRVLCCQANGTTLNESFLHVQPCPSLRAAVEVMPQAGISDYAVQFIRGLIIYQQVADKPLQEAVPAILEASQPAHDTGDKDGVYVGTLHSAKGREFDTVILPGWNEGCFPNKREDELEEERRLAYVGITRARRTVVITWPTQRINLWTGQTEDALPSRFIDETKRTKRADEMRDTNGGTKNT